MTPKSGWKLCGIADYGAMSLFVVTLAFLADFCAHSTRLTSNFSLYIKHENFIGLEIFSRKIFLHITKSLHWPANTRNRFVGSALHFFIVVVTEVLKIDFLWNEIYLASAILDGFLWFKQHITLNTGQNILVITGNFYGNADLADIGKFVLIYGNPPNYWFDKQRSWQIIF